MHYCTDCGCSTSINREINCPYCNSEGVTCAAPRFSLGDLVQVGGIIFSVQYMMYDEEEWIYSDDPISGIDDLPALAFVEKVLSIAAIPTAH